MEAKKGWNRKTGLLAVGAVILVVALAVLYMVFGPEAAQGEKSVTVEVVDDTGSVTSYETDTDAEYLRQVLEEIEGLEVTGQESDYGLMIESVNGVTADYNVNGAYWAVYVNGAYGNYGVDTQPVADKDVYRLEYTLDSAE